MSKKPSPAELHAADQRAKRAAQQRAYREKKRLEYIGVADYFSGENKVGSSLKINLPKDFLSDGCLAPSASHDPVNSPQHYTSHPSGVECITITEWMGFNLGNCVKYIWREAHSTVPIQDLEKARWYLDREISRRKKLEEAS